MMVFEAKRDWWFYLLVFGLSAFSIFLLVLAIMQQQVGVYVVAGLFFVLDGLQLIPMLVRCRYVLQEKSLKIFCGLQVWEIPYTDVLQVMPSRDTASAPAPSLDRVKIQYRTKDGDSNYAVVSPTDKDLFIGALNAKASIRTPFTP